MESSSSRLHEIQAIELHVWRCGCGKGELKKGTKQNRMTYIFPNLLCFQQALRPVPGVAAALQPMGRWRPVAMHAFAAVRLGLFHRAKPQQLFFEMPQYKRTKKDFLLKYFQIYLLALCDCDVYRAAGTGLFAPCRDKKVEKVGWLLGSVTSCSARQD